MYIYIFIHIHDIRHQIMFSCSQQTFLDRHFHSANIHTYIHMIIYTYIYSSMCTSILTHTHTFTYIHLDCNIHNLYRTFFAKEPCN